MQSISKLTASLASATSEITFAAANLNLDFALFKFEAPAAYQSFGKALSEKRRGDAEYGTPHATARKLGALFDQTLPATPTLITAYGTRVSEIAALPNVNPKGTAIGSLFGAQTGADGTTIWAAATSGPGAVPVHLLACMLARIWSGPQATSIWMEIVAERKKEIAKAFENGSEAHYATLAASQHEITRTQLADWDASARSWVRAADGAKKYDMERLRLIIDDLNLPVDDGSNPYQSVVRAWHSAMTTTENLLNGIPQKVSIAAALLGISAWHILPDIIAFGPSIMEIKHSDPLVKSGGVLTIGLITQSPAENDRTGVRWSLSLAHLKFYGAPIYTSQYLGTDNSRVSFDQFLLVALGSLSIKMQSSIPEAAAWLSKVFNFISEKAMTGKPSLIGQTASYKNIFDRLDEHMQLFTPQQYLLDEQAAASQFLNRPANWLKFLGQASATLIEAEEGTESKVASMLATCGRRRGKMFFGNSQHPGPYFGLTNINNLLPLLPNREAKIFMLRAEIIDMERSHSKTIDSLNNEWLPSDFHIRYYAPLLLPGGEEACTWQLASALPILGHSMKPTYNSHGGSAFIHKRWILINKLESNPCICLAFCNDCDCVRVRSQAGCDPGCHSHYIDGLCSQPANDLDKVIQERINAILASGEEAYVWYNSDMYKFVSAGGDVFLRDADSPHRVSYTLVAGDPLHCGLYGPAGRVYANDSPQSSATTEIRWSKYSQTQRPDLFALLQSRQVSVRQLIAHLESQSGDSLSESLHALGYVAEIYKLLPSATVAINTITYGPLHQACWVPKQLLGAIATPAKDLHMSRAQTFACVAMFESGNLNLDPDALKNVMAMSSGDSLYIATALLCDPMEEPKQHELTRVVGNIGRAGLAMLIPPQNPQVRSPELESWSVVNHARFDGQSLDCFHGTSMHLSFTGYSLPLFTESHGAQDTEAFLLESVVSVYDQGKWVGDLNILNALKLRSCLNNFSSMAHDTWHTGVYNSRPKLTAVDSWEELLEESEQAVVVRAHENRLARLALTCIAIQQGREVLILTNSPCWQCIQHEFEFDKPSGLSGRHVLIM